MVVVRAILQEECENLPLVPYAPGITLERIRGIDLDPTRAVLGLTGVVAMQQIGSSLPAGLERERGHDQVSCTTAHFEYSHSSNSIYYWPSPS
jgi:hypothetical protein